MRHKKIIISIAITAVLALFFWLGSRYPQLNEKAIMGGDAKIIGLSFDFIFIADSDAPWWEVVLSNTVNWIDTNKKGMAFGLLFAPALMLLFSLIDLNRYNNRFTNTLSGMLIGTPLGVCVNCATPIAKGVFDTSKKTEIALGTLFSSPTLNIIILSMLFTLFPLHFAILKIAGSIAFILLVVPIAGWITNKNQIVLDEVKKRKVQSFFEFQPTSDKDFFKTEWIPSLRWTFKNFFRGLWFIVKTTVPLMLLAGLLGNVLVSFFPQDSVVDLLGEKTSLFTTAIIMTVVAMVGTFLPVPIAFDVIVVLILSSLGLADRFSMTLLFTLGIYSIYPFSVIYKFISKKAAFFIAFMVIVFGVGLGSIAHVIEKNTLNERKMAYQLLQENSNPNPHYLFLDSTSLNDKSLAKPIKVDMPNTYEDEKVTVHSIPFQKRKFQNKEQWFKKIEAKDLGLTIPNRFSPIEMISPYAMARSITAGNLNNDPYSDLIINSSMRLFLAFNQNKEQFTLQELKLDGEVFMAVNVDLNNDGWDDLFVSMYKGDNLILWNEQGTFDTTNKTTLHFSENHVLTMAPAFADFDQDGRTDIFLGNWSIGVLMGRYSLPTSQNYILLNKQEGFKRIEIEGMYGETLSSIVTDLNKDGIADLIVANDFVVDDYFYLGNGDGTFNLIPQKDSIFKNNSLYTMSIATADIDNDLTQEIYMDQIDRNLFEDLVTEDPDKMCADILDSIERKSCTEVMQMQKQIRRSFKKKSIYSCPDEFLNECFAYNWLLDLHLEINNRNYQVKELERASPIPENWNDYNFFPRFYNDQLKSIKQIIVPPTVNDGKAALFKQHDDLTYSNEANQFKLGSTGWAWNAQFADINGDEWQDLYIANGFMFKLEQESNLFYQNLEGKTFTNKTSDFNLENFLPTVSYTYVDIDFDGDLDIISAPSVGPLQIYENTSFANNFIAFNLDDESGRSLIGSKIIIEYGNGNKQMREVKRSGGFKSFNSQSCYFGLSKYEKVDRIRISWNNGKEQLIDQKFEVNQLHEIKTKMVIVEKPNM